NAIILVVEPRLPGDIELNLVNQIKKSGKNAFLVLNKIDTIPKNKLLPVIQKYSDIHSFQEIFPVSSIMSEGLDSVVTSISNAMPQREALFPADALTDRSVRFLVGELIRERVFNLYRHEIPYDVAIEIEDF
ncbi:MAG TPA: GTPase Era, partial [Dehalococcoidia bacterium]|nr:GTPase Era [Dehalococcoidia bacterium]